MTVRVAAWICLLTALLASSPAFAAKDRPGRKGRSAGGPAAASAHGSAGCKEPLPKDADMIAGLKAYGAADWAGAAASLGAWAAKPGAESDPAAARGLYSLAYAQRASSGPALADATLLRAQPLLEARTQTQPTLEAWYYLQGLHQMRGDTAAQLAAIAAATRALDAGEICAKRDGDDWFRLARLHSFAGNAEKKSEALNAASAAYLADAAGAAASPYRALVEKELGDAALVSNDLPAAEAHFALAAKLDPSIPGVHRQLGLVYLQRGNIEAAANHWRSTWRLEREGGNAFMYAVPVMNKLLAIRKAGGMEPLTGLSQFTVPALEQNMSSEARTFLELQAEMLAADAEKTPFPAEKLAQMKAAEYRSLQYMLEYITRNQDLQEYALQNGLLPVIHGKGLPSRP